MKYIKIIDKLVLFIAATCIFVLFYDINYGDIQDNNYHKKLTKAQIEDVYRKLIVNSGQYVSPKLIIADVPLINAYTDGRVVVIYKGLIDKLDNEDELALILGHELSHVLLNHLDELNTIPTVIKEAQADKYGAFIAMRAGFDVCKGREAFKMLEKEFGDDPNQDHPANAYRYNQLNVGCEK